MKKFSAIILWAAICGPLALGASTPAQSAARNCRSPKKSFPQRKEKQQMAQAQVKYKRIIKGSTTQEGVRTDYVTVSTKSDSLAKGQIKAKWPNDTIIFMDIKWR